MDILRKELAPISQEAWKEIEDESSRIFSTILISRHFTDQSDPMGWDFAAISKGTIEIPDKTKKRDLGYGIFNVQPLIEIRAPFTLNQFELDNISRGLKDVDLTQLEKAAMRLAHFEDMAVFNGFKDAAIMGMKKNSENPVISLPNSGDEILAAVAGGIAEMQKNFVEGPYSLVVSPGIWKTIHSVVKHYPLIKSLQEILKGKIIQNTSSDDNFLVSSRGGDFEFTNGIDISIGYEGHNGKDVKLFFTETFTFQVNDRAAYIEFK